MRTKDLYDFDRNLMLEYGVKRIIGIDEVGRGPLAGPVVIAAVILNFDNPISGINDSKKIMESSREEISNRILNQSWTKLKSIPPREIDDSDIFKCTLKGMYESIKGQDLEDTLIVVDGNQKIPEIPEYIQKAIIHGDSLSASIAAASIIAKVHRDNYMIAISKKYTKYGFCKNKGYGTEEHIKALEDYGFCDIHRKTFCTKLGIENPSSKLIDEGLLDLF
jgi:ribonuclease HII